MGGRVGPERFRTESDYLTRRYIGSTPRMANQAVSVLVTPEPERARLSIEQIYLRYQEQVARWAQRLWGRPGDVEDIVQEVFLTVSREQAKVLKLEHRDDKGDPLERWLYRVTEYTVYNHRWRERWSRRLTQSTSAVRKVSQFPSSALNAFELIDQAELRIDVYDILDRLGDRYRSILILFELEGLSGEEIASLTGIKLATVWVRLHRARAKFLAQLAKIAPQVATDRRSLSP
jgi:RNA polymerase sigma-70 factor (ECF subfamily)